MESTFHNIKAMNVRTASTNAARGKMERSRHSPRNKSANSPTIVAAQPDRERVTRMPATAMTDAYMINTLRMTARSIDWLSRRTITARATSKPRTISRNPAK